MNLVFHISEDGSEIELNHYATQEKNKLICARTMDAKTGRINFKGNYICM